jgi:transglutaminase-like putative cysteine protease
VAALGLSPFPQMTRLGPSHNGSFSHPQPIKTARTRPQFANPPRERLCCKANLRFAVAQHVTCAGRHFHRTVTFMTVFSVRHLTVYRYARPVRFGEHRIMFRPRDSYDQRLLTADIAIQPEPRELRWLHDVFGNCVAVATFDKSGEELTFEANIRLKHTPAGDLKFITDPIALHYPFSYSPEEYRDLGPVIERHFSDPDDEIGAWARRFIDRGPQSSTAKLLMTLCYAIRESFNYQRRSEHGTQPPLLTLHRRRGTCRDYALFMMEAVRSLGFAARFVTGYIYVPSRDGGSHLGGGSTHAWCQVYLPGAGWIEFDPTNGIVGNRDLIRVAVAREPGQAIPLHGSFLGNSSDALGMTVQVNVTQDDWNNAYRGEVLREVSAGGS